MSVISNTREIMENDDGIKNPYKNNEHYQPKHRPLSSEQTKKFKWNNILGFTESRRFVDAKSR